jgi:hypothetical protein
VPPCANKDDNDSNEKSKNIFRRFFMKIEIVLNSKGMTANAAKGLKD